MTSKDNSALWRYCLWLYGQSGVEASCLLLQDQYQLKINLILLCLYAQQQDIKLSSQQLLHLHRQQEFYHQQFLWPLRNLRRSLSYPSTATWLLKLELQIEQHEISYLQRWLSQRLPASVALSSEQNLDRYWRLFQGTQVMPGKSVLRRHSMAYGLIPEG